MRVILMSLYCLTTVSLSSMMYNLNDVDNQNLYLFVSDDQNNMRRVYNSETVDENILININKEHNIIYCLYTRKNPDDAQIVIYNNKISIIVSNFDPVKVTVFIIHGWLGDRNSTVNTVLTEAFLQDGDVNVIVVDWCKVACTHNYYTAVASVPAIGHQVGMFIEWLMTIGVSFDKVHLVGHSLGAHVAGNAGRKTEGKVQRITGLDPAGPFWEDSPNRLDKSDAQYVEIIHTNTDCLGYKMTCGDADFFPNGGASMPDCWGSACSHSKSFYYMATTVKYNDMSGLPCASMEDVQLSNCEGEPYLMGNSDLSKNRSGIFRLNTDLIPQKNLSGLALGQQIIPYRRYYVSLPMEYDCIW